MTDVPERSWTWLDGLVIVAAPLSQGVLAAGVWAWGYGWLGVTSWLVLLGLVLLAQAALVIGAVVLLIWQRQTTVPPSPQRNFAVSFLIFVVALAWFLPWRDALGWVYAQGRRQLEAELPASALVEDCRSLFGKYADAAKPGAELVVVEPPYLPAIARLTPTAVMVGLEGVIIDQGYSFVPYGYRFSQSPGGESWELIWFATGRLPEKVLTSPPPEPPGPEPAPP